MIKYLFSREVYREKKSKRRWRRLEKENREREKNIETCEHAMFFLLIKYRNKRDWEREKKEKGKVSSSSQ